MINPGIAKLKGRIAELEAQVRVAYGFDRDAVFARMDRMEAALKQCREVLAMMTEPASIRSTSVMDAWTQAVAAEAKARAALEEKQP